MIQALLPVIGSVLDRVLPDKQAAAEAKLKMMELAAKGDLVFLESQAKIISEEAKSEHVLTATWRPICMLTFLAMLVSYWFGILPDDVYNRISSDMFDQFVDLLKIGLGGYVVGRSAEKFAKNWGKES
ncbi:MAG: hypothetical protein GTN99_11270 [Candidatus Dadabacteria bacterium]|nr:hypothetical protein [Candidatus Dadabacteria bacterium]